MILRDQIKNVAKKLVEKRPMSSDVQMMIRRSKPFVLSFADDGIVPNNPKFPLIVYRRAILFPNNFDPAAVIDVIFEINSWGRSWRDTVYDFVHYHSQVHEVMGVARGNANIEVGGINGRVLSLKAGDVAILPAGTGHRLIESSRNFMVVGAYPEEGSYDECTDTRDKPAAIKRIAKVPRPSSDPVYGREYGIARLWRRRALGR